MTGFVDAHAGGDGELVSLIASGNCDALGLLYDRYEGIAFAVALRILRSDSEAEDIVQDVFVEIWRRASSYEAERGTVRTWVLLLVRSRALDRRRSAAFAKSVPLDLAPESIAPAEDAQDHPRVAGLMAVLSPQQREVLEMGYFEGLSSSEIATRIGVPVGTVKSRVASALASLRTSLACVIAVMR
jgi:RNA polymerase sigma-70 factor, ECF subfamily